jgi:hypothetical protein
MRSLGMSWNTEDGQLACLWRELERIDLEPDNPSAMTPVEGAQA